MHLLVTPRTPTSEGGSAKLPSVVTGDTEPLLPSTSRQRLLSQLGQELDCLESVNEVLRRQNCSLEGELDVLRGRLQQVHAPVGEPKNGVVLAAPPGPPELPPELLVRPTTGPPLPLGDDMAPKVSDPPTRGPPPKLPLDDDTAPKVSDLSSPADQGTPIVQVSSSLHEFKLWPLWASAPRVPLLNGMSRGTSAGGVLESSTVRYGDIVREKSLLQRLVVRPGSTRQVCWDLLSIVCMFYDVLMFPMQVFPLGDYSIIAKLDLVTAIFWMLDMFNSFITGHQTAGILEMRPRKIAKHYLRSTFLIDLFLVTADWFILLNSSSEPVGVLQVVRIAKWPRMLRVLRLLRTVRLIKLAGLLVRFADSITILFSERVLILINIINTLAFILVACHIVACGWYLVGTVKGVGETGSNVASWVEELAQDHGAEDGYQPTVPYRYLTALHWAVTQFTPSSMEVVPRNSAERSYAIFTVLFALVIFSSFVSSITASMARARMMNADHHRLVDSVRRFILHHKLSLETGTRLHNFIRTHSLPMKKRGEVTDLVLSRVPEVLRQDLCQEMFQPALMWHPLFWHHSNFVKDKSMVCICDTAVSERFVLESEQLFARGSQATDMFCSVTGDCRYVRGLTVIGSGMQVEITGQMMIAEAVLWVPWTHQGVLISRSSYECIALNSQMYRTVLIDSTALENISTYARAFVAEVLRPDKELSDLCTDPDTALHMSQEAFAFCANSKQKPKLRKAPGFLKRLSFTRYY